MSDLRDQIAATLVQWHSTRATVCEHTQIISFGEAADDVMAVVQTELDQRDAEAIRKWDELTKTLDNASHQLDTLTELTRKVEAERDQLLNDRAENHEVFVTVQGDLWNTQRERDQHAAAIERIRESLDTLIAHGFGATTSTLSDLRAALDQPTEPT